MAGSRGLTVLDVLPEMAELIGERAQVVLRRALSHRTHELEHGPWDPAAVASGADAFAVVVLDGVVLRETVVAERRNSELLGPGDVATPWVEPAGLLPVEVLWRVPTHTSVAVLDRVFLAAVSRWPALAAMLAERYGETCARLGTHKAICQLPRVEDRISHVLWHAAERVGRMTPDAVIVPLRLTHEELGHLIGARRSTVTLALRELAAAGLVDRRPDGSFLLHGDAPSFVGAPPPRAPRGMPIREDPSMPTLEELQHKLAAVQLRTQESSARTAMQLQAARLTRARAVELREQVRRDRRESAPTAR